MRVLIVDNDARIVELVAWFLEQQGFEVDCAATFAQARAHLGRELPDLMLSDIDLGVEDGREELWALAREGILPPTLVVSGYLSPQVLEALDGLPGLLGTLSKPFDFELLDARIRAALAPSARPGPGGSRPLAEAPIRPEARPSAGPAAPRDPVPERVDDEDGWVEIRPEAGGGA